MEDLKLLQIIPSLESGGAEQGTVDVANYIAFKGFDSFIASSGGKMLSQLNRKKSASFCFISQLKKYFYYV